MGEGGERVNRGTKGKESHALGRGEDPERGAWGGEGRILRICGERKGTSGRKGSKRSREVDRKTLDIPRVQATHPDPMFTLIVFFRHGTWCAMCAQIVRET